jgi:hypothetical protein
MIAAEADQAVLALVKKKERNSAHVAQVVEHVLGKDEVSGSSPLVSSRVISRRTI